MNRFWISICLGVLLMAHGTCLAQETVRLTNGEWPPFMSQNAPYQGLASRIVTVAFALEGIRVEYDWFPWKRAYAMAESNEYDGSVGWSWSEERAEIFYYTDPVFELNDVFFHRKDFVFDWNSFEDLKGLRVGVTSGYFYGDDFEKAKNAGWLNIDTAHSDELGLRKLLAKRVDIFPLATEIGYAMIHDLFPPSQADLLTNHPKPIRVSRYAIIFNKKNPKNARMVDMFNQGLKKLKQSGQYDEYYDELFKGTYNND